MGHILYLRKGSNHSFNGLPSGYTRLSYIESTGTQYLDTGFNPNQDTRVVMDCDFPNTSTTCWIFGARTSTNVNFSMLFVNSKIRTDYNVAHEIYVTSTSATHIDKNKDVTTVNKTDTVTDGTYTSANTFSSPYSIYLFSTNDAGTAKTCSSGKIKNCKIYDNGTLVRNFVPCVNSSGTVGMYDTVGKTFYSSASSTAFNAGYIISLPSGYTRLSYIESTGSQYLDTGFKHNQNTRVVVDAQVTSQPSSHAWLFEGRDSTASGSKSVFLLSGSTWNSDYSSSNNRYAFSSITITERLSIDYNKNSLTINGYNKTWTATTFQSNTNLALFACNTAGTISGYVSAKMYSCQIYDNGTLIRHYVPCKNSSNVAGFWDLVNKEFCASTSSTAFVAGSAA